jgi:hypothetical protein
MLQSINKKPLCKFDMFVRLDPQQVCRYPNNSLTWCHRGDKYTLTEEEMLPLLLKMFIKHYALYKIAIIRDNQFSDDKRTILKYCNGVLEVNRLIDYHYMISKIILPQWLR